MLRGPIRSPSSRGRCCSAHGCTTGWRGAPATRGSCWRGPVRALLGGLHHHHPVRVRPTHRGGAGQRRPPSPGWSPARCWPRDRRPDGRQARRPVRAPPRLPGVAGWGAVRRPHGVVVEAGSLIAFRTLGATVGAATGPASMAIINRVFPRERRVPGHGLLVDGGRRWPRHRRRRRWSHRRALLVALDLRGPGPAHHRRLARGLRHLPDTERGRRRTRFDVAGSVTLAARRRLAARSPSTGGRPRWGEPARRRSASCSARCCWRRSCWSSGGPSNPLIPLEYFRRRNFAFPIVTQVFLNFTYMGGFLLTGLLLQDVLGYSVSKTQRPVDRPTHRLRHRRPPRRLRRGEGRRAHHRVVTGAVAGGADGRHGDGGARHLRRSFIVGALACRAWALGGVAARPWPRPSPTRSTSATSASRAPPSRWRPRSASAVGMQMLITVQMAREAVVGARRRRTTTAYLVGAAVAGVGRGHRGVRSLRP